MRGHWLAPQTPRFPGKILAPDLVFLMTLVSLLKSSDARMNHCAT